MRSLRKAFFNSNDGSALLALGSKHEFIWDVDGQWAELDAFVESQKSAYIFGYLSYGLKANIFNNLIPQKKARIPHLHFWVPECVAEIENNALKQWHGPTTWLTQAETILEELRVPQDLKLTFKPDISKERYLEKIKEVKSLIQRGDIYEVNFCQQFTCTDHKPQSAETLYAYVNQKTEAPFSGYVSMDDFYLACGSPERFLKREGQRMMSQPIKGTSPRSDDKSQDQDNMKALRNSSKDQSENIMIVDLVRNDLSKIAQKDSVRVDELMGLYSFKTVHQLISTVSCEVVADLPFSKIVKATFPMGSMTGAPKQNAVSFMDTMEDFERGLYSGSLGYFKPGGDFDFNVVIRSLFYDKVQETLTCAVGGAITIESDPEQEYLECLTKVGKLISLNHDH